LQIITLFNKKGRAGETKIVSTYLTQPLYLAIIEGTLLAAPSEWFPRGGRLAVDCAVKYLNGEVPGVDYPFRMIPRFTAITQENIDEYPWEQLFAPEGWPPQSKYRVPEGLRVD